MTTIDAITNLENIINSEYKGRDEVSKKPVNLLETKPSTAFLLLYYQN